LANKRDNIDTDDISFEPTKGIRRPGQAKVNHGTPVRTSSSPKIKSRTSSSAPKTGTIRKPGQKRNPVNVYEVEEYNTLRESNKKTKRNELPKNAVPSHQVNRQNNIFERAEAQKVRLDKRKKPINKKNSKTPVVVLLIISLIAIILFTSFLSYTYFIDKYENPINEDSIYIDPNTKVEFQIEFGSSTRDIADDLKKLGLIKNENIYIFLSKFNGYDGKYKAGTYILCDGLSYDEIMVKLSSYPESIKITFPEGFTTLQIASRLEANGLISSTEFLKAVQSIDLTSYSFIQNHKNRDYRLDGYLFPDTYEFDINASAESIIYKMLNKFDSVFTTESYGKAQNLGLSVDDVVTLASIVEKESKVDSERERIAGVFYNRLRNVTANLACLESSATVKYAYTKQNGVSVNVITEEMLKINDLYNTYLNEGLPPGPICSPSKASIEAVLNLEHHNYYFFYLKSDGSNTHIFSKTFAEHQAAEQSQK